MNAIAASGCGAPGRNGNAVDETVGALHGQDVFEFLVLVIQDRRFSAPDDAKSTSPFSSAVFGLSES